MVWGAIIGAAATIGGGLLGASASRGEASRNRDWQAQQYAERYRITMNDMRQAGLNPILAYSQGPGQSPSGSVGDMSSIGAGFSAAGNIAAQADLREQGARQSEQQVKTSQAVAERETASARALKEQTNLFKEQQATEFSKRLKMGTEERLLSTQQRRAAAELQRFINKGDAWISKNADAIIKLVKDLFGEPGPSAKSKKRGPGFVEAPGWLQMLGITGYRRTDGK